MANKNILIVSLKVCKLMKSLLESAGQTLHKYKHAYPLNQQFFLEPLLQVTK